MKTYTRLLIALAALSVVACDDSAGSGTPPEPDVGLAIDRDGDDVMDNVDVCPDIFDPDQKDLDGDGVGDLCDPDDDGDGVLDSADGCPQIPDPLREDTDGDGVGDACDLDDDADGIADDEDLCPKAVSYTHLTLPTTPYV